MRTVVSLLALFSVVGCAADTLDSPSAEAIESSAQPLTAAQRESLIAQKRSANAWLGNATGNYQHFPFPWAGGGRGYTSGTIFIGDSVGRAHLVYGLILDKWLAVGSVAGLGYPTTDELATPNQEGRFNHFTGGSVYWKSGTPEAFEVHGCHRDVWSKLAWERGPLGWPRSDEFSLQLNAQQTRIVSRFETGNLYFGQASSAPCERLSYVVLTSTPRPVPAGGATITSTTLYPNQLGATLRVEASNFAPNEPVTFTVNNPLFAQYVGSTKADANGRVVWQQNAPGDYIPISSLRTINGYVTVSALGESSHKVAVKRAAPGIAGTPYVGNH
jgi:hypothetical protein